MAFGTRGELTPGQLQTFLTGDISHLAAEELVDQWTDPMLLFQSAAATMAGLGTLPRATSTGPVTKCAPRVAPKRPSGYTRMQDYIPDLGKPSLPATTRLTPQQAFALQENLQKVVTQSLPGYRQLIASGRPDAEVLKGLQNQMNLLRWRFIDQVPGGREAIQGILREFPEITFPY